MTGTAITVGLSVILVALALVLKRNQWAPGLTRSLRAYRQQVSAWRTRRRNARNAQGAQAQPQLRRVPQRMSGWKKAIVPAIFSFLLALLLFWGLRSWFGPSEEKVANTNAAVSSTQVTPPPNNTDQVTQVVTAPPKNQEPSERIFTHQGVTIVANEDIFVYDDEMHEHKWGAGIHCHDNLPQSRWNRFKSQSDQEVQVRLSPYIANPCR